MAKYIITDPCYILTDAESDAVWSEFCDLWFKKNYGDAQELISKTVGTPVKIEDTGYGDWTNHIYGPGVIENEFFADAGMVCVCELTDKIVNTMTEKYHRVLGAIFEADEVKYVDFDTSDRNWTVVRVRTDKGLIESEESETEEDEDYEDSWDDENEY